MSRRPVAQSMFPDIVPDRPTGPLPRSVQYGDNADLMWTIRDLYLTGSVLDVTYGEGKWWSRFKPDPFTAHDLYKLDGVDFRALPHDDRSFDAVCFDPPYVISGSEADPRVVPHLEAYGIGHKRMSRSFRPAGEGETETPFRAFIRDGLLECLRVSRQWVLVKCMEFAQGGNHGRNDFHDTPYDVTRWALAAGAWKHDTIVHATGTGPGGHNIWEAKRCRRAHSYLLVFRVSP